MTLLVIEILSRKALVAIVIIIVLILRTYVASSVSPMSSLLTLLAFSVLE
jgi:hypothetical protein